MKTSIALRLFRQYQKSNLKPTTIIAYRFLLENFEVLFADKDLRSITTEDLFHFLQIITEHNAKSSKNHRYAQLKAFFNFIIANYDSDLRNPLDTPLMKKTFRCPKSTQRQIVPKEIVDEAIFNSETLRDRLLLEFNPGVEPVSERSSNSVSKISKREKSSSVTPKAERTSRSFSCPSRWPIG